MGGLVAGPGLVTESMKYGSLVMMAIVVVVVMEIRGVVMVDLVADESTKAYGDYIPQSLFVGSL